MVRQASASVASCAAALPRPSRRKRAARACVRPIPTSSRLASTLAPAHETSAVTLLDSEFDVGDDAIVLSSGNTNPQRIPFHPQPPPPTARVVGRRLVLRSTSSAIKFEAIFAPNHSAISNVSFEEIAIRRSSRGIGFQQRTGGGDITDIRFRDVTIVTAYPTGASWWGSGEPIWITNVAESDGGAGVGAALMGRIANVSFDHVRMQSENGVLLSGLTRPIGPITFANTRLQIALIGNCSCSKGDTAVHPFHTGCHDYRPLTRPSSDPPGASPPRRAPVVYGITSGFMLEGRGEARFAANVTVEFVRRIGEARPKYWGGCLDVDDAHPAEPSGLQRHTRDHAGVHVHGFQLQGELSRCVPNFERISTESASTSAALQAAALAPAALPLPPKWPVAGITYTAGRYCPNVSMASREGRWSLAHLASTGANWVSIIVTSYQWSINTTDIFPLYNASEVPPEYYVYVTISDAEIVAAIRQAKALGLSVLLKPHVDPLTHNAPLGPTWRGEIGEFYNESQWDQWFESCVHTIAPKNARAGPNP